MLQPRSKIHLKGDKMKVVFAHDHKFYFDSQGNCFSPGQFPYTVWKRYLNRFESLTVIARSQKLPPDIDREKLNISTGPNVNFIFIPSLSNPVSMFTSRPFALKKTEEALLEADALIARVPSKIGSLAVRTAERLGKPWAVEVVACVWDALWNYGNLQGKVYAPYALLRNKKLIGKAPFALYVTNEFLQKRYPCKGKIESCSNVEIIRTDDSVLHNRIKTIEKGRSIFKIGLIGSLSTKIKGIDTALKAIKEVGDLLPPFEFHILGSGDIQPWKKMAQQSGLSAKTIFWGTLPAGNAVNSWLDDIDLYLQPSRQEGLPRALIEAMSRGCPALGSTAGGIPELLSGECLFKPGDYRKLSELIVRVSNDVNWQKKIAQQNFYVARKYEKAVLDGTREAFWNDFAKFVAGLNN
jgi:glycosyltransferase involved in cell wall biosynthesis